MLLTQALTVIEAVSVILSVAFVYLFSKIYRIKHIRSLLGLPFGFLFLAISSFFFVMAFFARDQFLFMDFMWLRVVSQTWAFAFIALSYFLSNITQESTKRNVLSILSWSFVFLMAILGLLIVVFPVTLSSVYSANEVFTVVNLALLSYVILLLLNRLEHLDGPVFGLISAPIAFSLLWFGQFSFLIWNLDGGSITLITSHLSRIIGLLLFIRLYYRAKKEATKINAGK